LDYAVAFISQVSLALYHLLYNTHSQYIQQNTDFLITCEEISKSILSNLDRNNLQNNILSLLFRKLNCAQVNLYMLRGDDQEVRKKIGISPEGIEPEKVFYYEGSQGLLTRSISLLEPEIVNNTNLRLNHFTTDFDKNIRSDLILPLLYGEILVGMVELSSESVDAFDPATLRGFQALAQNIALALRNANLYHSIQTRWDLNNQLQAELGVLSAEVSLGDQLQILLDALEDYFSLDAAAIWLFKRAATEVGLGHFTSPLYLAGFRIKDQTVPETEQNLP
jgi:GAF domain-containing protein